ncbi:alpha/beta hydrolase [Nocardia cyriacigeorgica]|uniref:Alpha/beta hydrolase n=1 Tax=Nocardia cyriacigeorgica TaxID=135487 RepID=A0ABX0CRF8_9NOCA|nr:alpha/beta hydrolase [Nocardia cyriacigeorgica]NEW38683.1 alpha/beta hydrolase [Nocardia cyriacigeorgica]NEW53409.1 alpha/beta hydrolase [Nocardia cyriacigeorgica]NEW59075.1 alpha/beta hydrolase [Nocardia cyriacigeorgica]
MALVEVNGVRLLVEESGSGDPLVLVHGSWDSRRVWELVEQDLARNFRVFSYDRRGHTGSSEGSGSGTRRDDEDDLAELIGVLELAPANVVGNSFGASIALGLAARRPELFRTLCVHEPPLISLAPDDPVVVAAGGVIGTVLRLIDGCEFKAAARTFVDNVALGPGAWELMSSDEQLSMIINAHTFAGEQHDPHWAEIDLAALSEVGFPVLLTQGDQSPPFFATISARVAEAIDGAEVRTLPGTGHIPHETHPAQYADVVGGFMTR